MGKRKIKCEMGMFGNQSRLTVTEHDGCGHSVSSVWCIAGEDLQIASHRAAYGGELPQRLRFRTVSRVHEFLPQFNNPTENNSVPTRVGLPSSLSGSISFPVSQHSTSVNVPRPQCCSLWDWLSTSPSGRRH